MSVVTVQLGQCGNQIGFEVFDALYSDSHCPQGLCSERENEAYQASSKERFFSEEENGVSIARAVLVDMEPKVINQTLSKAAQSGQWKYAQHSCFCQKEGSGNNWAYGYSVHGPRHEESIMNLIQKEVEKCDSLSGFFIIMSMAGGTGSGLGAFVTQNLQDQYSNSLKMNQIIWPYGTGEVIVQNYNSVLTLSHLYRSSDALLVHENDAIHKICAKLMNIKQISFSDINQVLAHQLGSVFQPTYSVEGSCHYRRNPLGINWQVRPPLPGLPTLGKVSLNRELHFNTSIANLVILRGKDVHSADLGGFKDPALYTSWLEPIDAFNVWKTQRAFSKYEKSAALVSNSQFLLKPLDTIVGKAWNMFASKAYIHQYTKFGIEEEDFLDSFTLLEQASENWISFSLRS
ncbi:tubulin delta chain isoform X4 [Canis lupus baileyi]|uniref:tubulin delta chain isoform X4 n=1 Tax=Canis lupus dingo TaxID=286419 RepID=UPI000BAA3008|nr:tubulin delta chain isoform X4 [Canis lupus dingo]XP_038530865.1 tubulin delta chain isoform X4 [Canis lupus familiaris]|eukprot:XP_022278230.1 tubulin delta chain isoform X3 [Canis lupus familiaris]